MGGGEEIKFPSVLSLSCLPLQGKVMRARVLPQAQVQYPQKLEDFLMALKCQVLLTCLTPYRLMKQPLFQQLQPGVFESFLILFYPLINI